MLRGVLTKKEWKDPRTLTKTARKNPDKFPAREKFQEDIKQQYPLLRENLNFCDFLAITSISPNLLLKEQQRKRLFVYNIQNNTSLSRGVLTC